VLCCPLEACSPILCIVAISSTEKYVLSIYLSG
jgi:hypothetical protein